MEEKNYISISIKILDIIPSIEKLIIGEEEEYLIIFQGNNTFFDLKKIIILKEEIIVNLNKNKKTIIISLVKSDILISTSIFNIKEGEHWIVFNCESSNNKTTLINKIKIKIDCKIKKYKNEYNLIKNNSLNNLSLKEIFVNEKNKKNKYSPIKSEKIDYNNNDYSNRIKASFSNNPNKMNKNYHSILTENLSKENFKNNQILSNEQKLLSKLNNIKISKNISFNKNIIKNKIDASNKNVNKKIYINLNKNNIENVINDEYILKTIEGIKPNKKTKRIVNKDNKNKNEKNHNDSNKNIKDANNIYKNYFYSSKQKKEINIKIPINNNNKISKSPYISKTFKREANNNIKINKSKNFYISQNQNDLFPKNNDEIINSNMIEEQLLNIKKEENNNYSSDYSYDTLNDDSYELNNFYKLKEDFLLLYTEEYNKNVKEDLLKLEIDLFVEKIIDLINAFHININEKLLENKIIENKYKTKISKYILLRKLYSKLQQLKCNQKVKTKNDLNVNNHNLKYSHFLVKDEINLLKSLFPNLNKYNTDLKINKNNQLKEIINIILNKNENKKLLNENSNKWLEKNNIYKEITINEDVKISNKINNNNKMNQINENNDSSNYINNNSVNNDKNIYKKKKAISHSLKNKINSSQN